EAAHADARCPFVPAPGLRAGTEPTAHDFVHAVDAVTATTPLSEVAERFAASPSVPAIPVLGNAGVEAVISRACVEALDRLGAAEPMRRRPCIELADPAPIRVEAELDLGALTAILVESDARRLADGFVIVS